MIQEKSKTVQDYKVETADRFSLGMAINNAAVICEKMHIYDLPEMKALIIRLFKLYKEIRKEELGY